MKRAAGYIRVSTDMQVANGMSLEVQKAKIEAMAVVQGVELVDLIVDAAESAKDLKRPGAQRLLEMVRAGEVRTVIVAKLDRLTRSLRDLAELVELFNRSGVALVSVAETLDTGSAAGRMVLNLLTTVSQWEREVIGERTRDVMRHMKSEGRRVGTVPYGWRAEGKRLVEDDGERLVLGRIIEFHRLGESLRGIAETLNAEGYRTRRGVPWRHQYVENALKRLPPEPVDPPADSGVG